MGQGVGQRQRHGAGWGEMGGALQDKLSSSCQQGAKTVNPSPLTDYALRTTATGKKECRRAVECCFEHPEVHQTMSHAQCDS